MYTHPPTLSERGGARDSDHDIISHHYDLVDAVDVVAPLLYLICSKGTLGSGGDAGDSQFLSQNQWLL